MAVVTFYEKPGCKGNLRQKTLLAAAGHTVQAKSLKTEAWTTDRLLAFLGKLPVSAVVQPGCAGDQVRRDRAGKHRFRARAAMLLDNPLLIRRPLMEVGDERRVGFDIAAVDAWIGLKNVELPEGRHRSLRAWPGRPRQLRQPRP